MLNIEPTAVTNTAFNAWRPPPPLNLSQWADENFYLSPESSAEPGKWHTYPTQRDIMNAFTDPTVETLSWMKCSRVGYTKIIDCAIGYHIEHDPCSQLVVQPTIDDASGYSKEEIAPMIRDVKELDGLVSEAKSRDSDNTILKKKYPGGYLHLIGANSARGFRRITVRNVYFDEVDGYPPTAGQEGDQIKLGIKRTEYAWNRKIVLGSTPTIKRASRIETSFEKSDKRYCFVPCPICGHMQYLKFANLKWPKHNPHRAYYECEHCKKEIDHKHKLEILSKCEWRPTKKFIDHAGFFLWAAYSYSPNSTWGKIAERFADAKHEFDQKGDDTALRTVINTDLAETYEEIGDRVSIHLIAGRDEEFEKNILPEKVLLLTAGADIQKDRIEVEVVGWGMYAESWSITYEVIQAENETSDGDDICWKELGDLLEKKWQHPEGMQMRIICGCIDSGYATNAVGAFTLPREINGIYAIKGTRTPWSPIVGKPSKKSVKRQYQLFPVGTDTAKALFYARLKKKKHGAGFCHFPNWYDESYFKMLTAEELKTTYKRGALHRYFKLKKGVKRNEALDCRVYNMAALEISNPNWKAIERNVRRSITRRKREFAKKDEAKKVKNEQKSPPKRRQKHSRRRGGFVRAYKK